jgi:polyphosphate kinase
MGSADWMNRNLHSRIEVVFPVYDPKFGEELSTILQLQLKDSSKAVLINTSLDNPRANSGAAPLAAQEAIYEFVKTLGK